LISSEEKEQAEDDRFWRESHTTEEKHQRIAGMANKPDQFPPGRKEFLEAMAHAPAITAAGKARAKLR